MTFAMSYKQPEAMNKIGASDSTRAAYGSALTRFNEYQTSRNDPLLLTSKWFTF